MRSMVDVVRRSRAAAAVLTAALAVVACGGGERETTFDANRVIALGDETSLIVDLRNDQNGNKYTVNGTVSDTDPTIACGSNELWIQVLARLYGLVFPQCNPGPTAVVNPQSRIRAAFGARAADLSGQIATQLAESSFRNDDLVTILVGTNDVIAQYQQYPTLGEDELVANVEAAAVEIARQVNRLADLDTRIIVSTIPDISYSPFALAERAAHSDTDRAALIGRMVVRFNAKLRASIRNDGTRIGLVLADEFTQVVARFPGSAGISNATTAVCDLSKSQLSPPSVLDCTPLTLIAGGSESEFLWADDRHLAASAQAAIGSLAAQRAQNNPF